MDFDSKQRVETLIVRHEDNLVEAFGKPEISDEIAGAIEVLADLLEESDLTLYDTNYGNHYDIRVSIVRPSGEKSAKAKADKEKYRKSIRLVRDDQLGLLWSDDDAFHVVTAKAAMSAVT